VVTYAVTGGSGDYTLDFTVNNTTPGTQGQDIYWIGVNDPIGSISGAPASYETAFPYNGENLTWFDGTYAELPTGTTLSGFDVLDTSATAPTSVPYFAYGWANGALYDGPDNLGAPNNPLFEGNAGVAQASVPDSAATLPLLGLAFGALAGVSRKFRKA